MIERCRGCGQNFSLESSHSSLIDLGEHAIIRFKKAVYEKDDFARLHLIRCNSCSLIQLDNSVNPDRMFRDYFYLSGVNASMRASLLDIVKQAESLVDLQPRDIVVDIGSNDGTLLDCYRSYVQKCGFEPAQNMNAFALWMRVNDYFSADKYFEYYKEKAKIITAIAMFYDLEDPNKFCADVKKVLHENGIFILQLNDLGSMIKNLTIDHLSHEHLCYYSLSTLEPILNRNGLRIFGVFYNDVNGGSIRILAEHDGMIGRYPIFDRKDERNLSEIETFVDWARQLKKIRADLRAYILTEKAAGKTIYGYGASTRGNTLLQWLGFDSTIIEKIADRNPLKHGRFTAGGNIPICSEEEMRVAQPDYLLVLPYYFKEEFLAREKEYLKKGGKMIFPLPQFQRYISEDSFLT